MQQLGKVSGIGSVSIDGEKFDDISYNITVWLKHPGGLMIVRGTIPLTYDAEWKFHEAGKATLIFEGGEEREIIHAGAREGGPKGQIVNIEVNGEVPGFGSAQK